MMVLIISIVPMANSIVVTNHFILYIQLIINYNFIWYYYYYYNAHYQLLIHIHRTENLFTSFSSAQLSSRSDDSELYKHTAVWCLTKVVPHGTFPLGIRGDRELLLLEEPHRKKVLRVK